MSLLNVQGLSKHYGAVQVLRGVSFEIGQGERRAIIGPNGAGKTTLFNIISGVTRADGGTISFDGQRLDGLAPEAVWRCGLARTFQRNNLFFALSVEENVRLAVQAAHPGRFAMLRPAERYRDVEEGIACVLDTMDLREVRRRPVGALSYGDQRKLEIALALAGNPKLLLLDEPTAGMSPAETGSILHYLDSLPRDISLVIIEHDMDIVFSLAERILVLNFGEVLADGVPEEIHKDERVQAAYLGVG